LVVVFAFIVYLIMGISLVDINVETNDLLTGAINFAVEVRLKSLDILNLTYVAKLRCEAFVIIDKDIIIKGSGAPGVIETNDNQIAVATGSENLDKSTQSYKNIR